MERTADGKERGGNPLRGGSPLEGHPKISRKSEALKEGGEGEGGGGATLVRGWEPPYGGGSHTLSNGALTSPFHFPHYLRGVSGKEKMAP